MISSIYINLPVENVERSKDFFRTLGFDFNSNFEDDTSACLVLGKEIYAMLIQNEKFKTFSSKRLINSHQQIEVLNAIQFDNRNQVDEIAEKAVQFGAQEHSEPVDHGFMYTRSFSDLDGHVWELIWFDPTSNTVA